MKIAFYGSASGELPAYLREKARETGREIARGNHTLITGACPGLPYEAVFGAKEYNGIVLGFSPAKNINEHIQRFQFPTIGFDEIIFIPENYPYHKDKQACYKFRNVSSVAECDAAIFIAGGKGSNTEFANAYAMGRVIGVVAGTGGITRKVIPTTTSELGSGNEKPVIFNADPKLLIPELELLVESDSLLTP